jgi:general secretion pathway protein C
MRHAIEGFIKRRFFVVHLLLLSVAAVLCAKTATALGGHVVAGWVSGKVAGPEKPAGLASASHTPAPKPSPMRDFNQVSDANIFLGKRETVTPGAPVDQGPGPDLNDCDAAQRSSLRLRLVGTAVFTDQESSMASIVDEGKGGAVAEMYSINSCEDPHVGDGEDAKLAMKPPPCERVGESAVLQRIEPERVCIWNESEHRMEYLAIAEPPEKGPLVSRVAPPPTEPSATDDLGASIRKTGENSYEVGQGEVDKALNNLAELSTQARIVPAFEGGKTVGFKLFSIRPGSLYSKIGLQNGDVITRINGYEMSSPEKGLEIYTKLKDSKSVTVDMKRRGKPMTLDYNITQ